MSYLLLGAAIGAVTGIPIGPVNVAIIDAAYRHHLGRAIAVGLGGATADMGYALIGVLGLSPLLLSHPSVPPILYAVSGVVLIIYGILTVRAQPVDPAGAGDTPPPERTRGWFLSGYALGLALILLNPAALIAWVVIAGSSLADATRGEGVFAAIGIGVGSAFWFTVVAHLAHHGKKVLGKKVVWITRVVGAALIVYGTFCIGRAAHYLLSNA
ncbi:MAG TPA: LysE family transporter [Kofleriaceae bacterium]|nr:LysE family transporter [Kofleriaceae bacterium]